MAFAALNADPVVMEHFLSTLTREQSNAFADLIETRLDRQGFGLWAVEVRDVAPFIGFVGLAVPEFDAPFTPAVEIGWRLARTATPPTTSTTRECRKATGSAVTFSIA